MVLHSLRRWRCLLVFPISNSNLTSIISNEPHLVEIIGYIARIKAHSNTKSVPIYSIQTILILLAPALFAASIYMVLGRLIIALGAERLSPIHLKWITKIFVCGDVVAFLGQAVGR